MRLFLISQTANNDYDTYDAAVVCAPDAETARHMDPATGRVMDDWSSEFSAWAPTPTDVTVRDIGEAAPDLVVGVVCASFNAG